MVMDYAKALLVQLEEDVALFNEMGISTVQKVTGIIKTVNKSVNDIKVKIKENPFTDLDEEIDFFKHVKPRFHAIQIYEVEVFKIENDKPLQNEAMLKVYYEQELSFIRHFFDKHQFIYQYYLLNGTELDTSYFVRGKEITGLLIPYSPDLDPDFSTACDFLFAKFSACERLQEFLLQRIYGGVIPGKITKPTNQPSAFKWTGDKSNLIELAYSIYDARQINCGEISIAEIMGWLEESFNINLSRHYQIFSEIKNRKSVSRTRFLDHARDMLIRHMDEGDAFIPTQPKSVSGSKSISNK